MKRMRLLSLLLALVLVCTAMPVTAAAADGLANATACTTHTVHTEGQSAEDCTGLAPYLAPDGTAWAAVGDDTTKVKTWHCFQQDIDAALTDALHRMLRRETAFTLYIAVKKSDYDPTTGNLRTALYERLGNARAAEAVTQVVQWLGQCIAGQHGRVVKTLGDGILAAFTTAPQAVQAVVHMMRGYHQFLREGTQDVRLQVRVGIAGGDVVEVDGDCLGDAVNLAARLCERASPGEVWVAAATAQEVGAQVDGRWVQLGALASGRAGAEQLAALQTYSRAIGLAFQVQDDILDVESDTATLGKRQGADIARDKPTYPALLGLQAAKAYAVELRDQALDALRPFDAAAEPLRDLARYIVERRH